MASTKKTTTLELSQFVGTDVPGWLTDYNSDMSKIDAFASEANSNISEAVQSANSANTTAQAASTAANSASSTATDALNKATNLETAIGNWERVQVTDKYTALTGGPAVLYNKALNLISIQGTWYGSTEISAEVTLFKITSPSLSTLNRSFSGGVHVKVSGQSYPCGAMISVGTDGSVKLKLAQSSQTVTEIRLDCMGTLSI